MVEVMWGDMIPPRYAMSKLRRAVGGGWLQLLFLKKGQNDSLVNRTYFYILSFFSYLPIFAMWKENREVVELRSLFVTISMFGCEESPLHQEEGHDIVLTATLHIRRRQCRLPRPLYLGVGVVVPHLLASLLYKDASEFYSRKALFCTGGGSSACDHFMGLKNGRKGERMDEKERVVKQKDMRG